MTMMTVATKEKKRLSYFREVQAELKKVTWTSRQELFASTKAVVFTTLTFGFVIYFADLAIRGVMNGIGAIARMIFG